MFFNQPIITPINEIRVSPQINFRFRHSSLLLGNRMYLSTPSFQLAQFTLSSPQQQPQQQKTGWELAAEIICAFGLVVIIGGAVGFDDGDSRRTIETTPEQRSADG